MTVGPTQRFADAVSFAIVHHVDNEGPHTRKGSTVPYLAHLLSVAALVWEAGGDETMAVAAVLHDVLEDTDVDAAALRDAFGDEVTDLVRACSDGGPDIARDAATWHGRKETYLEHLRGAPVAVKTISAADKLHNATSIVVDAEGDALDPGRTPVWERFNAPPQDVLWYYDGAIAAFRPELSGTALLRRLEQTVTRMHELAPVVP